MAKDKETKTNVMRILDREKIPYHFYFYDHEDGKIDGMAVAAKLHQDVDRVFKTLVTKGTSGEYHVFVLPVAKELSLKAAARSVGEKAVEMIHVKDINQVTGYIRGGCSPVGMKKKYGTVFDESCLLFDTIFFSAGKIGAQVETDPRKVIPFLEAGTAKIAE